ncbi:MAG: hypothetical protein SPL14_06570 [Candidatus Onthomorpha sp.]|nr:hypothetical protein [Bacteroidales bacterium]MDD7486037.1 hypothetical protein [Bacteroidales bacterium]MDY5699071.1 hypothetical protein [Candidatus Onthomorpha sp.]
MTEFEYYDTPQVGESDTPSKRIPHLKTSAQTPQDKVFEYIAAHPKASEK